MSSTPLRHTWLYLSKRASSHAFRTMPNFGSVKKTAITCLPNSAMLGSIATYFFKEESSCARRIAASAIRNRVLAANPPHTLYQRICGRDTGSLSSLDSSLRGAFTVSGASASQELSPLVTSSMCRRTFSRRGARASTMSRCCSSSNLDSCMPKVSKSVRSSPDRPKCSHSGPRATSSFFNGITSCVSVEHGFDSSRLRMSRRLCAAFPSAAALAAGGWLPVAMRYMVALQSALARPCARIIPLLLGSYCTK
mmetsp:Transcript_70174/g.168188  ORF Transcript_70174/g.168188 Transcript_70174/m.168188 type:complete len:252 (-) Transcript_70174:8-763(-)